MTTQDLLKLLRLRHESDKWGYVEQVPDGTGARKDRTADAMAMGLWRNVGIYVHGFEVKASRSDWLRELQAPEKSQGFVDICDFWWIVAADGVVKLEELPSQWGLLVPSKNKTKLMVKRPATKNPAPVPPHRDFLAAVFRVCARSALGESERKEAFEEGYKWATESLNGTIEREKKHAEKRVADAEALIAKFEKAAGIEPGRWWHADSVAKAAVVLSHHTPDSMAGQYERMAQSLEFMRAELLKTAGQLRPLCTPPADAEPWNVVA